MASLINWTTLVGAKTLAGSLANWANNSQITSGAGGVADFIQTEAMLLISSRLRHWRMLVTPVLGTMTAVTTPTPTGQDTIALPTDFAAASQFFLIGIYQRKLDLKPEDEVMRNWTFDGSGNRVAQQPVMYGFNQSNFFFDSPPDLAYSYQYTYYQQIAALSSGAQTNFITQYYPSLFRAACMIGVCEWTKEQNQGQYDRTYWEQKFEAYLESAQADSDKARGATEAGAVFIGGGGPGYPSYGW